MNRFVFAVVLGLAACRGEAADPVVVYTTVDEVLSAEVFAWIEERTGLEIRAVYDTEATKVTGLYLRLLEERSRPRADVFWNGEFSRTLLLDREGLLAVHESTTTATIPETFRDPENRWFGMAVRARVLAYNTDRVKAEEVPRTLAAMTDEKWEGRLVWANPMFGSTGTHCGAFLAFWGREKFLEEMKTWVDRFRAAASNGQTAKLVAEGAVPLGLSDTDDVFRLKLAGEPIDCVPVDVDGEGTMLIPATAALIEGGPNPEGGRRLMDALLDPEVERRIAFSPSRHIPVRADVEIPADLAAWREIPTLPVSFDRIADSVDESLRLVRPLLLNP